MFQTPTCRCTLTSITPPCPAATVQIEDLLGLFYHSIIPAIPCVTRAIVVFLCQPWRLEATPRATATALQWEEPFKSNPPCLRLPAQREHEEPSVGTHYEFIVLDTKKIVTSSMCHGDEREPLKIHMVITFYQTSSLDNYTSELPLRAGTCEE